MKYKCKWIGVSGNGYTAFQIHPDEHTVFLKDMNQYDEYVDLTIEVKKYKPVRTLSQNAFFHKTVAYLAHELHMDAGLVKDGIKFLYGYQMMGLRNKLVPIPSHLCNSHEEMSVLIEGCFIEAGEQGIDMRDYINEWEQYKKKVDDGKAKK